MKMENNTTIPTDKLRDLIQFARPSGISKFNIVFRNTKYELPLGFAFSHIKTASCSIPINTSYPRIHKGFGAYLTYLLLDENEAIIHIIAHELYHIWQFKHKKLHRVKFSRGKTSEREADVFALRKVREWRKAQQIPIIFIPFE